MTQNVPLDTGDTAVEAFFDDTQEMLSGLAVNFRLELLNATTIRVPAGAGHDQVSISIEGRYRYVTATVTRAMAGGAAGVYDIYATAADTDAGTHRPPLNDYAFALAIVATGDLPAGVGVKRLVGRLTWTGAAISLLTSLVPPIPLHARAHDHDGADPLYLPPWITVAPGEFGTVVEESISWAADPARPVGYYRAHGVVRLRGVALYGNSGAPTPAIFGLPAGYRPPQTQSWAVPVLGSSPAAQVELTVYANGAVEALVEDAAVALDAVSFRVA